MLRLLLFWLLVITLDVALMALLFGLGAFVEKFFIRRRKK